MNSLKNIKEILKNNYVDGIFHTHVSLITPKGKYLFNRQTLEEFWKFYCEAITDENVVIGIAEKPQDYLPVLVDVDLRIRDDKAEEFTDALYTEEQLTTVIGVYQSVLRQILDNFTEQDLTCVALEKKMYMQTKNEITYLKHGFHLHFPFIFLNKVDQEVQLIPRVKDKMKELKVFEKLGIEDSGEVIDKSCCKVPWLLYGSRKSEEHEPYRVSKVYNHEMKTVSLEKALKSYQIFDHNQQLISIKGKVNEYLPRILSILPYGRATKELRRGLPSILKEKIKAKEKASSANCRKLNVDEALKIARRLLPMLSDSRASDRNDWMTIGWLLYNISDGHPDGLDLWCDFSSRCEEKYDENVCVHQWERMVKKDITLGTLRYYAGLDNPIEYKKFKDEDTTKHITNSLSGSHNDIAKALFSEYGDEFVCASITNKVWFQFVDHHWHQIEEGVFLREKISGRIVGKYFDCVKSFYEELKDCQDKGTEAMLNSRIKQVTKMISNLKSAPFKNHIMKEAMEVFYDPRFKEKLDADPYLIGFKNGVYDLKQNIFRTGRPEDFISKTMTINYTEYSENDEIIQDIFTFLEQIFPDKSLRKYFMDISSDVFVGGNLEKTVVFWTGEGDNGKSVMQKLFEIKFGPLAVKLNTVVITGKKPSAGQANADLARIGGGVRWVVLEEPDPDEAINVGTLKHLSGSDSIYARDLFERGKDGREIVPLFKLSFICNKLPRMKHADKAVWNRVRVLPFESTFCRANDPDPNKKVPETYEEQLREKKFPMDKKFAQKLPMMAPAFAWILLQHRLTMTKIGYVRNDPDKVIQASEFYRRQNDVYRQFVEETIIEDSSKTISLTELYALFKDWFKESLPNNTIPVKNEIEEYFVKAWGTPDSGKKWKGYRLRTLADDLKSGDVVEVPDEALKDYEDDDIIVVDDSCLPPIFNA